MARDPALAAARCSQDWTTPSSTSSPSACALGSSRPTSSSAAPGIRATDLADHRRPRQLDRAPTTAGGERHRAAHAQGRRDRRAGRDHRRASARPRSWRACARRRSSSTPRTSPSLARRFPQILINVIQTQRERLFRASARSAALFSGSVRSTAGRGGEEVGLVAGPSLTGVVGPLVAAAQMASTRPVTFLDRSLSFAGALTASDELASENATVLIPGDLDPENARPSCSTRSIAWSPWPGTPRRWSCSDASRPPRAGRNLEVDPRQRGGAGREPRLVARLPQARRPRLPAPAGLPAGGRRPRLGRAAPDPHEARRRARRRRREGLRARGRAAGARGGGLHRRLRRREQHRRLRRDPRGARLRRAGDRRAVSPDLQRGAARQALRRRVRWRDGRRGGADGAAQGGDRGALLLPHERSRS